MYNVIKFCNHPVLLDVTAQSPTGLASRSYCFVPASHSVLPFPDTGFFVKLSLNFFLCISLLINALISLIRDKGDRFFDYRQLDIIQKRVICDSRVQGPALHTPFSCVGNPKKTNGRLVCFTRFNRINLIV